MIFQATIQAKGGAVVLDLHQMPSEIRELLYDISTDISPNMGM